MGTLGNGTIGDRIKECRKDLGMSQEKLAELLYMKKSTICKYENNQNDVGSSMIVELANVLHTTPNYLLLGEEDNNAWFDDIIHIVKSIKEPKMQVLAKKQLKCIAELEKTSA